MTVLLAILVCSVVVASSQPSPPPAATATPAALQLGSPPPAAAAAAALNATAPDAATSDNDDATPLIPFAQCGGAAGECTPKGDSCKDAIWEDFKCPETHPCQRWDLNYWQCLPAGALAKLPPAPTANASKVVGTSNASGASAAGASNTSAGAVMLAAPEEIASARASNSSGGAGPGDDVKCGPGEAALGKLCVRPTRAAASGSLGSGMRMRWAAALVASASAALMLV